MDARSKIPAIIGSHTLDENWQKLKFFFKFLTYDKLGWMTTATSSVVGVGR